MMSAKQQPEWYKSGNVTYWHLCDIARSRVDFRFWRKSGPDADLHSCIYRWKVFCSANKIVFG
jgi:hypothetical protein